MSRTVSESLGGYLRTWGIPAIPRPRINTVALQQGWFEMPLNLTSLCDIRATLGIIDTFRNQTVW